MALTHYMIFPFVTTGDEFIQSIVKAAALLPLGCSRYGLED